MGGSQPNVTGRPPPASCGRDSKASRVSVGSGAASLRFSELSLRTASAAPGLCRGCARRWGGARACGLHPDGGSRDTDPGAGPHLPGHCARDAATSRACRPSGTARPTASPGSSVGTAPCPSCPSSWLAELLPGVSPITSRIVPGRVLSLVPLLQRGGAVCGAGRGKLRSPRSKGVRARDG